MVVVEVSGIRPVLITFVFGGTLEPKESFTTASDFVRPIATLDAVVIKQTLLTLFSLWYSPQTLRIEVIAEIGVAFVEYTELPRASMRTYRVS